MGSLSCGVRSVIVAIGEYRTDAGVLEVAACLGWRGVILQSKSKASAAHKRVQQRNPGSAKRTPTLAAVAIRFTSHPRTHFNYNESMLVRIASEPEPAFERSLHEHVTSASSLGEP